MQRMQHTQDCSGSVGGRGNGLCSGPIGVDYYRRLLVAVFTEGYRMLELGLGSFWNRVMVRV